MMRSVTIGGRSGPPGSARVTDRTRPVVVDTIVRLRAFDVRPGRALAAVEVEAVANDVVFGIMGATVRRGRKGVWGIGFWGAGSGCRDDGPTE